MIRRLTAPLLAALLAAALPAVGQIGEPAAACESRLGPALERTPEPPGVVRLRFQKGDLKADATPSSKAEVKVVPGPQLPAKPAPKPRNK